MRAWIGPGSLALATLASCGGGKTGASSAASSSDAGATAASASSATGSGGGAGGTGGAPGSGGHGSGGAAPTGEPYVYVGGYGSEIRVFHLDLASGALTAVGSPVAAGTNPSFLAVDPAHRTLFAVNEGSGASAAVASFHIDAATGALTFLSRVSSAGDGPAYVSTDRTGKLALVANYGGGTVAVLPVAADGTLSDASDVHDHGGGSANPHEVVADAANAHAFVPNKGLDTVTEYALDAASGKLTKTGTLTVAAGAGPRHLDLHPDGKHAYLIDELDSTMSALSYDAASGKLTVLQTLSTLPAGFQGANTGAEVQVSPSGAFVYGSNRGHDSIVVFHVEADGTLSLVGHQSALGKTPRHFQLERSGKVLLVANQDSGNVVTFRVDPATGLLTPTGQEVAVPSPSYVGVVYLAAP